MERLFIQLMMYNFQFLKMDPYDWFCGPGSHITCSNLKDPDNVYQQAYHIYRAIHTFNLVSPKFFSLNIFL